ncbi:MAG: hypothetical protein BAA00_05530 [Parageobacillus thermoglucosidasius]|nr:MAG: hypothetical protein BAA00_05530 [Parageobacillus thermoglucosidasius]RDE27254.1 hypothetical protein DV714_11580 [Parageobacillus thermoglucosidasius]
MSTFLEINAAFCRKKRFCENAMLAAYDDSDAEVFAPKCDEQLHSKEGPAPSWQAINALSLTKKAKGAWHKRVS